MIGNRRFIDFLVEGIIFILAVSSIAQSIISSLYLPISYGLVLIFSSVFYVLFHIYTYNRLTLFIGTPLTIYLLILYADKNLPIDWWHRVVDCANWLVNYALGNEPIINATYIYPSAWIITGIVSLIFFVVMLKLKLPILSIMLASSIIGIEWYLGHTHIVPYIWIYAISFICLISARYRKELIREYSMPQSGIWQLSILPLALSIVLISIIIVPSDTSHLRWEYLENKIDHMENRWTSRRRSKGPRTSFRLTQTGFQTSSDRLGGPVKINDDTLLKVKSPYPVYLRGSILNKYTGTGWTDSTNTLRYRISDPLNKRNKNRALDLDEEFWKDLSELEDRDIISRFTIDIEPVGIETSAIFAPLRTVSVKPHTRKNFSPYINDKGELFAIENISKSQGYSIDVIYLNSRHKDILNMLNDFIPKIDFREYIPSNFDAYEKILDVQQNYSNIDAEVPTRVLQLAESITKDATSPIHKAVALEKYLKENYEYTLSPPHTPEDRDFVDYFLFDLKEGYCTYFASAMAVMGRAVGLPTRYVEGLSMPLSPKHDTTYEVQKSNSHAWVEIYFPNVGWITFDPTPPTYYEQTIIDESPTSSNHYDDLDQFMENYMDVPHNLEHIDETLIDERASEDILSVKIRPVLLLGYALLILIAMVACGTFIFYQIYNHYFSKLSYAKQIEIYYLKILDLLRLYSFPIESGETPYKYARRVDRWLINKAGSMMNIATLLVRSSFAGYLPTDQDVQMVEDFYKNLKSDTKNIIGIPRYVHAIIHNIPKYYRKIYNKD